MHYLDRRIHAYLPSLQPSWVKTFNRSLYDYRDNVPYSSFKSLDEFNWYDGVNPRFRHSCALYSPGHANLDLDQARKVDRLLFERNRASTFLLVDSGGYQVGKGLWPIDQLDSYVTRVLKWQEEIADLAVILEVPTWTEIDGQQIEFERALELTNGLLRAYAQQATGKIKFLNPLHGNTFEEGKRWFDATRWFNDEGHAVGWCFSSIFSLDLYEALRILAYMIEQEHFPRYLHFLGKGTAQVPIIADLMRRTVPRCYPSHLRNIKGEAVLIVTADASSEFQTVGRFVTIYRRSIPTHGAALATSPFTIKTEPFESQDRNRFPHDRAYPDVEGPILGRDANGVKFGDILAPVGSLSQYNLDAVSAAILIAHNLWVKLDAYEQTSHLERGLRRIAYGMLEKETYEFADIMSRLMHESTNRGQFSDLGRDLVACTVGLWRVFSENVKTADERYDLLAEFETSARALFKS